MRVSILSLLLAVMVLAGCGGKNTVQVSDAVTQITEAVTSAAEPTSSPAAAAVTEAGATPSAAAVAEAGATPTAAVVAEASVTPTAAAVTETSATPTAAAAAEITATQEAARITEPSAVQTEVTVTASAPSATPTPEPVQQAAVLDENGSYSSKEDVALYLHTYGHLPGNFITKKEAQALGWPGGGLEAYAPGKCIGGDHFGNYEGKLPDGKYHECDIDTLGESSRGAKRIIYSDSGEIYYTEDHYESFTQLY